MFHIKMGLQIREKFHKENIEQDLRPTEAIWGCFGGRLEALYQLWPYVSYLQMFDINIG